MMKKRTCFAILLCFVLLLGLSACRDAAGTADVQNAGAAAEQTQDGTQQTEKQKEAKKKETKESQKDKKDKKSGKDKEKKKPSKKAKNEKEKEKKSEKPSKKTANTKSSGEKTAARKTNSPEKKTKKTGSDAKPSGHVLTVKKGDQKVYFTESQLRGMGTDTYKYSFRNKDSSHRQFLSCTGVSFSRILDKSGFSGSTARIRSTDGYTNEFSIGELRETKKAFLKKSGSSAKSVPAIITVSGEGAFRLCFGQAADDSDDNGDYNAQYWVKWIDTIEIH